MERREFLKKSTMAALSTAVAGTGLVHAFTHINDNESKTDNMKIVVLTGSPRKNGNSAYLAEQFISVFSDPVHISRYIFACIVHCTDDLLQIHAGTAFFHKCLTNGIFNLYEDLVNLLLLSGLHGFFEFCQIIFDCDFLNGVLFFHINKKVSTKEITILKGLCSHIV